MRQGNQEIKCVIFDCGGVLVDSESLCCRALAELLSSYGVDTSPVECMAHFQGGKVADILSDVTQRYGLNVTLDELEPQYRARINLLFERYLMPVSGIKPLIQSLKRQGIHYCVVSNSPKSKIQLKLRLTGLENEFESKVFSAFDANSWKPAPDILRYAAMNMGFSPQECLYVDDTPTGVQTGINAGMKTVHYRANNISPDCDSDNILEINDILQIETLVN